MIKNLNNDDFTTKLIDRRKKVLKIQALLFFIIELSLIIFSFLYLSILLASIVSVIGFFIIGSFPFSTLLGILKLKGNSSLNYDEFHDLNNKLKDVLVSIDGNTEITNLATLNQYLILKIENELISKLLNYEQKKELLDESIFKSIFDIGFYKRIENMIDRNLGVQKDSIKIIQMFIKEAFCALITNINTKLSERKIYINELNNMYHKLSKFLLKEGLSNTITNPEFKKVIDAIQNNDSLKSKLSPLFEINIISIELIKKENKKDLESRLN